MSPRLCLRISVLIVPLRYNVVGRTTRRLLKSLIFVFFYQSVAVKGVHRGGQNTSHPLILGKTIIPCKKQHSTKQPSSIYIINGGEKSMIWSSSTLYSQILIQNQDFLQPRCIGSVPSMSELRHIFSVLTNIGYTSSFFQVIPIYVGKILV